MNCIIYIKTDRPVIEYRNDLSTFLGNDNNPAAIYSQTSISSNLTLLPQYFYGNANHSLNYLIASESANRIRIFIEGINKKDNLDQLISGVQLIFSDVNSFLKSNKIDSSQISATIWSEDEEVLRGDFKGFWKSFFSFIPDIPTSIYLSILTVLYSVIQPKYDNNSVNVSVEQSIKTTILNLIIIIIAILLWMFIKTIFKEKHLSFTLK